jgi:methyl-accepting chemotaxis protein
LDVRAKILGLLLVFGLVPAASLFGFMLTQGGNFRADVGAQFEVTAVALNDVIDRNLFERYGDVQAFGLNAVAHDPDNWRKPSPDNPLVRAMNGYMSLYGVYKLMLLVGPDGSVLAVNSTDAFGKPLATDAVYQKSYTEASWFRNAMSGAFLEGRDGLTGTVVEQPAVNADVASLYGEDGYVIPFAAPVRDAAGTVIAVWVNFADFGVVEQIVGQFHERLKAKGMSDAELTVLDPVGNVIVDYDPVARGFDGFAQYRRDFNVIGKLNLAEKGVEAAAAAVKGEQGEMEAKHARKGVLQAAGYAHSVGAYGYPGLGWSALVRVPAERPFATWYRLVDIMLIALAVTGAAIVAAGFMIGATAAKPIRQLTGVALQLADSNTAVDVPGRTRSDELGDLAKAIQVFKENGIEKQRLEQAAKAAGEEVAAIVGAAAAGDLGKRIDLADKTGFFRTLGEGMNTLLDAVASAVGEIAAMMSAMAHGDLSKRISGDYRGQFLALKQDANGTADKLAQIVGQAVDGMANIKASTTEIATGATDLSSRTEEQVASLEEIAASIRRLNTTVLQSAENAGQASQLAVAARTAAENGGAVATAAVNAMSEIEQSSQKISDIVGMIDEIAFQTNLLALNAAVEAARAGEAGRGFAVVAGEVRALAQRSSQASKDIKSLILNSSSQVKQGVELVNKAGATLNEIVTAVKRVSDIVAEISAANKEQSASVGEVQEAVGQIEQATQQNAAWSRRRRRRSDRPTTKSRASPTSSRSSRPTRRRIRRPVGCLPRVPRWCR